MVLRAFHELGGGGDSEHGPVSDLDDGWCFGLSLFGGRVDAVGMLVIDVQSGSGLLWFGLK